MLSDIQKSANQAMHACMYLHAKCIHLCSASADNLCLCNTQEAMCAHACSRLFRTYDIARLS